MHATAPTSSLDLLDERVLGDPYPVYEAMRLMGPAIRLERHGVWAVPGYDEVRSILDASDLFRAEGGRALTELAGTILASNGEQHARLRRVLSRRLAPTAVARRQRQIQERARRLVAEHTVGAGFDAVELARAMAVGTVMELMGLTESSSVPVLDGLGLMPFDAFGPENACGPTGLPAAGAAMLVFLHENVTRGSVRRGSWTEAIFQAVDAGKIDEDEAVPLGSAYAVVGIDSTILGLAGTITQLAHDPEQWFQLREDPARAEAAFHEAVRLDAPIQGLGRLVTEPVDLGGIRLEAGEGVWLLLGSAGRDPRKWGLAADDYNLRRAGADKHLSLGAGPHACPGSHLALMQARALLRALAERCTTLSPASAPVRAQTHVLRGHTAAPISVSTAGRRTGARQPALTSPPESPR
ncbi:cytochrome P450 [Streptomyces sp. NPDC048270]|uniref:cytochrome P450 n=1 Tax=Streptomyces sp. NPDC048270 TaxID=3154615 RepID=UPI0034065225